MTTPKRKRRQLALAELIMGVAISYAVTEPGNEDTITAKYELTQSDMDQLKETIGARLEAWSVRAGYAEIELDSGVTS